MRKAVVQIDINDEDVHEYNRVRRHEDLFAKSKEQFKRYAEWVGADYHLFTDRYFDNAHCQNEIFRVLDMDEYDLVFTVDIDIMINKWEDIFPLANDGLTLAKRVTGSGINSGIVVWGREARRFTKENLDIERANTFDMPDQDELLQYWSLDMINWIPRQWNDWTFRPDSIFHHFKSTTRGRYESLSNQYS